MSSRYTRHDSLYNAAIALNNAAITLLERQHYSDAVDTFRISISTIQALIDETRHPIEAVEMSSCTKIHDTTASLKEAERRCSQSSISNNVKSDRYCGSIVMVKCSYHQSALSVVETIITAGQNGTTKVFSYIVIEPMDQEAYCGESLGVVGNSILYNFGVVHCMLACQLGSNMQLERTITDKLLQTAFDVLRPIELFFMEKLPGSSNAFHDRGALLLCTLFAQTMSEVARHLQNMPISEFYNGKLLDILVSINAQESLIPTLNRHAAMA